MREIIGVVSVQGSMAWSCWVIFKYGSIAPLKSNTFFAWNMIWWFWEKFLLTYCYLILWIINNQHHSASLSPLAIWNNIFIRVSFPLWKKIFEFLMNQIILHEIEIRSYCCCIFIEHDFFHLLSANRLMTHIKHSEAKLLLLAKSASIILFL